MTTHQSCVGPGPPAASGNGQYVEFLSIAASVLGGSILQVYLSPPTVVTASASNEPEAFGYCMQLEQCPAWQRCWQLSSVVAFCFVILSLICCGTNAIPQRTRISMAAAVIFFFLSFVATTVAVLATVFLSASRVAVLATCALLICLVLACVYFGWEGLVLGLDEIFLAPQLFKAAEAGKEGKVEWYLNRGTTASWAGNKENSSFFKDKGYFLAAACGDRGNGASPLHVAACGGRTAVVKELLNKDADIHARDSMGCTALHIAAAKLQHDTVEELLGRGADAWARSTDGWTPLLAAMGLTPEHPAEAPQTSADIWKMHLDGIEKDMTNVPMSEEREQTVKCLLRRALPGDTGINAISPADGLTALQLAIKRSWDPFTKHLLHAGAAADVPRTAHTSLGLACITLRKKYDAKSSGGTLVRTLLVNGAGKDYQDKDGNTALHTCVNYLSHAAYAQETNEYAYQHLFDCAMVLLTNGANVDMQNADSETPLMRAVATRGSLCKAAVSMLLDFQPNLGAVDNLGRSALHHAIDAGNTDAVDLLLTAGMHAELQSQQGLTPLQQAAADGLVDIAALLINAGADVNYYPPISAYEQTLERARERLNILNYDVFGHVPPKMPPLMHAISHNKPDMVWALLERGADVNQAGGSPYPRPLFCAAQKANGLVIEALVRHGAKVNSPEAGGNTPLHAAAMAVNVDAVKALLYAGADPSSRNRDAQRARDVVGQGPGRKEVERLLDDALGHPGQEGPDNTEDKSPEAGRPSTPGSSSEWSSGDTEDGSSGYGSNNATRSGARNGDRDSAPAEWSTASPHTDAAAVPAAAGREGQVRRRSIFLRNRHLQPWLRNQRRGLPLDHPQDFDQQGSVEKEEEEKPMQGPEHLDGHITATSVKVVVEPNGDPLSPATPVPAASAGLPATSASPVWASLQAVMRWVRAPVLGSSKSPSLHLPTSPQPSQTRRKLPFN